MHIYICSSFLFFVYLHMFAYIFVHKYRLAFVFTQSFMKKCMCTLTIAMRAC